MPVDCIYEGDRKSYINPNQCIDCGRLRDGVPVGAIQVAGSPRKDPRCWSTFADSRVFFKLPLPGSDAPIGDPGGALKLGEVGIDAALVAAFDG